MTQWRAMVDYLRGRPAPALPDLPGRRHVLATEADRLTASDVEAALLSDATDAALAIELGITRQAIWQRRQRLRERLADTTKEPT